MQRTMGRSNVLAIVAATVLGGAAWVRGEVPPSTAPAPEPAAAAREPAVAPTPEAPPTRVALLAEGLKAVGVGQALSDAGISVTGFIEGSYTRNFDSPASGVN